MPEEKLQPRNRTARLAQARAAGNPVTAELESGVGNCFPGLELDLRNLDRRFFPYLAVDFFQSDEDGRQFVTVGEVALARAESELAPEALLTGLRTVAQGEWRLTRIEGEFAGFGAQAWPVDELGGAGTPPDPWTAVRLLRPGTNVSIELRRVVNGVLAGTPVPLSATRASYLTDDGAFAEMFEPGELTQSLCSPWTHDFRDCGCYYWASNHPDVVQPALPAGVAEDDPDWTRLALWQRSAKQGDGGTAPPEPGDHDTEMVYFEISERWQALDVVLDGREQVGAYRPDAISGVPLPAGRLEPTLRYAAGVELAVMLEYLAAAYSLAAQGGPAIPAEVRDDARAAQAELLRVATQEMRHLRLVNDLLFDLHEAGGGAGGFEPALGIATAVAGVPGTPGRDVRYRALTPATLTDFIAVEAPSRTVDALYGSILATYQRDGHDTHAAIVGAVMAEGADHYETFRTVEEWLGRHAGTPYLLDVRTPAPGDPALAAVQQRYEAVLGLLHRAYRTRGVAGASDVVAARRAMLGPAGVQGACEALATARVLPVFAVPADPRFAPVAPPP